VHSLFRWHLYRAVWTTLQVNLQVLHSYVVDSGIVQQPRFKMFHNPIAYRHRHISSEHILFECSKVPSRRRNDHPCSVPSIHGIPLYHEFMTYPSTRGRHKVFERNAKVDEARKRVGHFRSEGWEKI